MFGNTLCKKVFFPNTEETHKIMWQQGSCNCRRPQACLQYYHWKVQPISQITHYFSLKSNFNPFTQKTDYTVQPQNQRSHKSMVQSQNQSKSTGLPLLPLSFLSSVLLLLLRASLIFIYIFYVLNISFLLLLLVIWVKKKS